jgi:serine/threonine protein kinase
MPTSLVSLELDSLPQGQADLVNDLAYRFEKAYRSNDRPSIESSLAEVHDPHARLVLLHVLIELERLLNPDHARYRNRKPHAKGGFGVVAKAEDHLLHRTVAYKTTRDDRRADPAGDDRFLNEGRITGRLEHPGIPPVYDLGCDDQGRPFYAMRFIEGRSLTEAIRRFHREVPTRKPHERNIEFRGLLNRFVTVCETVAYAHSQGVIHRDLKPEHIKLGRYGQTIVLDWRLAKEFGGPDALGPDPSPEVPVEANGKTSTVGTPAYMSPEQAGAGAIGLWSDVFGLGAILYELLTDRAPYRGSTPGEVRAKAKACQFIRPRKAKRGIPRALEAICLKAMEQKPEDRYASADALAQDVRNWLADEPVSAGREPWLERAWRLARRHRTATSAGAAVILAGLVGLVVVMFITAWANRELQKEM